jgi:hypothetical protein
MLLLCVGKAGCQSEVRLVVFGVYVWQDASYVCH